MKRVALINDLSGFGKCSLTAAIPVISVMGMQACPLPTAVLTAQTGFPEYYCDDYTEKMDIFTSYWERMEVSFDGICSGYLADHRQISKVQKFLERFKRENTLFLADPVLGDHGCLFPGFDVKIVEEMKELIKSADVITPNLTEACLLSSTDFEKITAHQKEKDYRKYIFEMASSLKEKTKKDQTIIITGILTGEKGNERIGNMVLDQHDYYFRTIHYTGKSFSGTGDLFSAVVCGSMVKGMNAREAVDKAVYFLQEAIEEASREGLEGVHGVNFEHYLHHLWEDKR